MRKVFSLTFVCFLSFIFPLLASAQDFSQTRPIVKSISASKVAVNKINIRWVVPENFNAASIAVFRDSKPIATSTAIFSMKPVAELPARTTLYTDSLTHYGEYYYALVSRDKNGRLYDLIIPNSNATMKAVKLEKSSNEKEIENPVEERYQPAFLRDLPLPYLDFIADLDIKPTVFNEKAMLAGRTLAGKYYNQKPGLMKPYIFEEDLVCAPDGDDYFLFQSLKTYFIKKDYKNSAADLKKFLKNNRDPYTTSRAVFYLAESQYYCRNYRSALILFLFLEDDFPSLAKKWVDSTLDQYQIPVTN